MSAVQVGGPEVPGAARGGRVRERARDALVLMGFSATVSAGLALLLLFGLGR